MIQAKKNIFLIIQWWFLWNCDVSNWKNQEKGKLFFFPTFQCFSVIDQSVNSFHNCWLDNSNQYLGIVFINTESLIHCYMYMLLYRQNCRHDQKVKCDQMCCCFASDVGTKGNNDNVLLSVSRARWAAKPWAHRGASGINPGLSCWTSTWRRGTTWSSGTAVVRVSSKCCCCYSCSSTATTVCHYGCL